MKRLKRLLGYENLDESGFTLIEMLIVVGIIVALAAAIVPQVVKFGGEGTKGKKSAEESAIQVAMDSMLADQGISSVTPQTGNSTNIWESLPLGTGAVGLATGTTPYLRDTSTIYFYCWDLNGKITRQDTVAADCPGP